MRMLALLVLTAVSFLVQGDDTKVLVPVSMEGPYSYLEHWQTSVAINNLSDQPITTPGVVFHVPCGIPEGCASNQIESKTPGYIIGPPSAAGLVLRIPEAVARQVFISARVAAKPRHVGYEGSELPVARESDFRSDLINIPSVPMRAPYHRELRTHLRVYTLDEGPVSVRVQVRTHPKDPPGFDRTFSLQELPSPAPPGYLFVDLQRVMDPWSVASIVSIDIIPVPRLDGSIPRIWAFSTAVDNTSDEVTVVTGR